MIELWVRCPCGKSTPILGAGQQVTLTVVAAGGIVKPTFVVQCKCGKRLDVRIAVHAVD